MSTNGLKDSLLITSIEDGRFPDGIGAPANERLHVVASGRSQTVRSGAEKVIFYLTAKNGVKKETIQFLISLKETFMYGYWITYEDFNAKEIQVLETRHGRYDDVIKLILPEKVHKNDKAIREMYWSKSVGYVRLVQTNGTIWDLTKTTYR